MNVKKAITRQWERDDSLVICGVVTGLRVGLSVQAGIRGRAGGPACTETNAVRSGGRTAMRRSGEMRLGLGAAFRPGSNNCRTGNHDHEDERDQSNLHL